MPEPDSEFLSDLDALKDALTDVPDRSLASQPNSGSELVVLVAPGLSDETRHYIKEAKAAETRRGYRTDWKHFSEWCRHHARQALPASPETVALYLTACAQTAKASTLQRRLTSISQAHAAAAFSESPTKTALVRSVFQGIRREHGVARQVKTPALSQDVIRMVHALPADTLAGMRDRALILVGFAGAFRRSELAALTVADVAFHDRGMTLTIRWSKTDQEGAGQPVGIPFGAVEDTCPVRALQTWMETAGISEGPLLRSVDRHGNVAGRGICARTVADVVKRTVAKIGKDPGMFAGHSLRAGLATSAAMHGKSMASIMKQTRHRSEAMVRVYIRDGSLFRDNAADGIGL